MNRANRNAKEEFLEAIGDGLVKCAEIRYSPCSLWGEDEPEEKSLILKVGYSDTDWKQFLDELDFGYDAGYGGQELFGTIWFEDDVWMTRAEYDGSEWWQGHSIPDIPEELI